MGKWIFDVDHRIVIAVLSAASSFTPKSGLWTDEELVEAINEMQLDDFPQVTVQSLNAKFGTKETSATWLFPAKVIRNCTRKGARCEYHFAAQGTILADFLDLKPQWSTAGSSERSEESQSRTPARRVATPARTAPRSQHVVSADEPTEKKKKKKKKKKREIQRPPGKGGTPARPST
jgi:hypothetical protein